MNEELRQHIKVSIEAFKRLPPEEQEAMLKAQRESWVRAEMSWPKAKFKIVNGAKVYDSYEDYCND